MAFAKNPKEQMLMRVLRDLKNSFAGLNTQVMVSEIAVSNENKYTILIQKARETYNSIIKTKTNLFDILIQHFSEIVKLAKARAEEISKNKQASSTNKKELLITQKDARESQLYDLDLEYRASVEELNSIKEKERENGIKINKTRKYFEKGTWEYERKKYLKQEIKKHEEDNYEYKSIKQRITNIETTLGALFVRVSDIMNELIGKATAYGEINTEVDYSCMSLKNLAISFDVPNSVEEKVFLDVLINEAIVCKQRMLSDDMVLNLIVESANKYKNLKCANTEKGKLIIDTLREFWAYKHNQSSSFSIPDDMMVLKSLMAFFVKPFGFDQIDRYVQNKGIESKVYGYMLRGALIGYAAFPKTFTDTLYANRDIYIPMDEYLTTIHKQVEAQYPCD